MCIDCKNTSRRLCSKFEIIKRVRLRNQKQPFTSSSGSPRSRSFEQRAAKARARGQPLKIVRADYANWTGTRVFYIGKKGSTAFIFYVLLLTLSHTIWLLYSQPSLVRTRKKRKFFFTSLSPFTSEICLYE